MAGHRRFVRPRDLGIGALALAAGATLIVRADIASRRTAFQAEARTAHRVLSQATSRLDAVLGTLVLMSGPRGSDDTAEAAARLPALYPQVMAAWRREGAMPWPPGAGVDAAPGGAPVAWTSQAALAAAEAQSQAMPAAERHAALARVDGERAAYTLVLAGAPASFALQVDARRLAPPEEWPWEAGAPVRVTLTHRDQVMVLQDGAASPARPFGLTEGFELTKTLASASQPLVLHAQRFAGPAQWPWVVLAAWVALCAALVAVARRWQAARDERQRAAALARLAQAARLNTLGELAAGLAHELNQPLAATLAGTQAALRLLRDGPASGPAAEDRASAVQALELASAQARRAADVVARLRRQLQPGGAPAARVPTDLTAVARRLAALLAPELAQRAIELRIEGEAPAARADPVAVEQILHNLVTNAMLALEAAIQAEAPARSHAGEPGRTGTTASPARRITVRLSGAGERVRCSVHDTGPGVAPEVAERLFEPFFSTREGGLGLGLPLCQTLALAMDGQVRWQPGTGGGAEFTLDLPAAAAARMDDSTSTSHEPDMNRA